VHLDIPGGRRSRVSADLEGQGWATETGLLSGAGTRCDSRDISKHEHLRPGDAEARLGHVETADIRGHPRKLDKKHSSKNLFTTVVIV
jgi:hypothetical protein